MKPDDNGGKETRRRIVFVTGLSGAGLSTAMNTMEDLGYDTLDNVPLFLMDAFGLFGHRISGSMAIGINSRTIDFTAEDLLAKIEVLMGQPGIEVTVLYLHCSDEALQRRYTETRRRHPQAELLSVHDGIALERKMLAPIGNRAHLCVDTTDFTVHDLKRWLDGQFRLDGSGQMQVFVTSFGFRRGIPREADMVFDARFLANPHYVPELREKTGLDAEVGAYVEADPDFDSIYGKLAELVEQLLPRYAQEGKAYLTIAIGCTGGKHRSVFMAEKLARRICNQHSPVRVEHRDIKQNIQPIRAEDREEPTEAGSWE